MFYRIDHWCLPLLKTLRVRELWFCDYIQIVLPISTYNGNTQYVTTIWLWIICRKMFYGIGLYMPDAYLCAPTSTPTQNRAQQKKETFYGLFRLSFRRHKLDVLF